MTPYERGYQDCSDPAKPAPPYPKGDASWEERLYHRGWLDAKTSLQPKLYSLGRHPMEELDD